MRVEDPEGEPGGPSGRQGRRGKREGVAAGGDREAAGVVLGGVVAGAVPGHAAVGRRLLRWLGPVRRCRRQRAGRRAAAKPEQTSAEARAAEHAGEPGSRAATTVTGLVDRRGDRGTSSGASLLTMTAPVARSTSTPRTPGMLRDSSGTAMTQCAQDIPVTV